ncbi:MAG: hypothetical protein ACPGN3_17445 [Opitutales bacterium]
MKVISIFYVSILAPFYLNAQVAEEASGAALDVPSHGLNTTVDNEPLDPQGIEFDSPTRESSAPEHIGRKMSVEEVANSVVIEEKLVTRREILETMNAADDPEFFGRINSTLVANKGTQGNYHRRFEYLSVLGQAYEIAFKKEDLEAVDLTIQEIRDQKKWLAKELDEEKEAETYFYSAVSLLVVLQKLEGMEDTVASVLKYLIELDDAIPPVHIMYRKVNRDIMASVDPLSPAQALDHI